VSPATDVRIRTALAGDLPALQRVFTAASLSNADDAPLLLANPQHLVFAGDGLAEGRTRVAVDPGDRVVGFATVVADERGDLELEDLFVDPPWQRRGLARRLVHDAVGRARESGHPVLMVTANPHALDFYRSVGFVEVGQVVTDLGAGPRMRLDTVFES
jgi:GNAT superfamily N-acetyltransferase